MKVFLTSWFSLLVILSVGVAQAESETIRLRILSYNIHHAEGVDRKLDVERIARVINDVRPDVVALQEVDQGVSRTLGVDQPAELARLTKMHAVFGDNIQFGGGKYGNAILSRFPISSHKNHRLPNREDGEQRGVLEAAITVPDQAQPLVLFATHLDHREDDQERFESAQAINALAVKHGNQAALLAGDLNDTAGSRTLREFSKSWATANDKPQFTVPVDKPDRQIDFILIRPAARWKTVEVQVLPEAVASDHRAVLAVLELRPAIAGADDKPAKVETTHSSRVGSYSIVVSDATNADADWKKVVTALTQKYEGAEVVTFAGSVRDALPALRRAHPRYTCFVATSAEAGRQFVANVHRMTRQFDDDPYADTLWGILTGYDAANALKIAQHDDPLTVRKVASGTEVALDMCSQGVWYDELVQYKTVSIKPDGEIEESRGPADTTHALAETLTKDAADLFVTSGHATERDWQIGFRYRNGQFHSEAGHMFGVTTGGERFRIQSKNPKVYLPIGNCLMGHIDGPDAMALAWMDDVGVHQMIGYTVLTWYGYSGWGVLDYFVEQPGRYTLTEAFHANQHALIHRLDTYYDDLVAIDVAPGGRNIPPRPPNEAGRSLGLTEIDSRGLLWDRDTVAFYGDPAWQARMAPMDKAYDQKLTIDGDEYTLTITPRRGSDSFKPVNTNGAQRGWRPIVELLDDRISNVKIIEGADLNPVVTDDFILIPNPRTVDSSRQYRVRFTASRN
ncbi:MAG: endonuclease/exonuclease/phosphatase family metal-dependent hydrolase [Planctomycetaceae bacterium]